MNDEDRDKHYWSVRLWWQSGRNSYEAGGHFSVLPGDTWRIALDRAIKARSAPDELTSVSISLEGRR